MDYGFDTRELDKYAKDMMSFANDKLPKESKKYLKKSAGKLSTVNKNTFKSSGAAAGSGFTENEMVKRFKAGKTYKYNGNLSCRAYAGHPLAHLSDLGFIHKGGFKIKDGPEKFIPGYHFMAKASQKYESTYYTDTQNFINDMIKNI